MAGKQDNIRNQWSDIAFAFALALVWLDHYKLDVRFEYIQGAETDFIISVFIATLLFYEVNSYLFLRLKTGELQ